MTPTVGAVMLWEVTRALVHPTTQSHLCVTSLLSPGVKKDFYMRNRVAHTQTYLRDNAHNCSTTSEPGRDICTVCPLAVCYFLSSS